MVLRCKEAPLPIPSSPSPRAERGHETRERHGSHSSRKHDKPPDSPPASSSLGGMFGLFDGPFDDPKTDPFQPSGDKRSAWELLPEQQEGFQHNHPLAFNSTEPWYYNPYTVPPMESGPADAPVTSRRFNPALSYAPPPRFGPLRREQPEEHLQPNYAWQGHPGGSAQPPTIGPGYPYNHRQGGYPRYDYTTPQPQANA